MQGLCKSSHHYLCFTFWFFKFLLFRYSTRMVGRVVGPKWLGSLVYPPNLLLTKFQFCVQKNKVVRALKGCFVLWLDFQGLWMLFSLRTSSILFLFFSFIFYPFMLIYLIIFSNLKDFCHHILPNRNCWAKYRLSAIVCLKPNYLLF